MRCCRKGYCSTGPIFLPLWLPPNRSKLNDFGSDPKKSPAQTMKDYKPISCCNLLYKVISKILTNRLKAILPSAMEPNQNAFIKGRLLLQNFLLATELVNGYHLPNLVDRSTIKLDISKAFDTVNGVSSLQCSKLWDCLVNSSDGYISLRALVESDMVSPSPRICM